MVDEVGERKSPPSFSQNGDSVNFLSANTSLNGHNVTINQVRFGSDYEHSDRDIDELRKGEHKIVLPNTTATNNAIIERFNDAIEKSKDASQILISDQKILTNELLYYRRTIHDPLNSQNSGFRNESFSEAEENEIDFKYELNAYNDKKINRFKEAVEELKDCAEALKSINLCTSCLCKNNLKEPESRIPNPTEDENSYNRKIIDKLKDALDEKFKHDKKIEKIIELHKSIHRSSNNGRLQKKKDNINFNDIWFKKYKHLSKEVEIKDKEIKDLQNQLFELDRSYKKEIKGFEDNSGKINNLFDSLNIKIDKLEKDLIQYLNQSKEGKIEDKKGLYAQFSNIKEQLKAFDKSITKPVSNLFNIDYQLPNFNLEENDFHRGLVHENILLRQDLEKWKHAAAEQYKKTLIEEVKAKDSYNHFSSIYEKELERVKKMLGYESGHIIDLNTAMGLVEWSKVLETNNKLIELKKTKEIHREKARSSNVKVLEIKENPVNNLFAYRKSYTEALEKENQRLVKKLQDNKNDYSLPEETYKSLNIKINQLEEALIKKENMIENLTMINERRIFKVHELYKNICGIEISLSKTNEYLITIKDRDLKKQEFLLNKGYETRINLRLKDGKPFDQDKQLSLPYNIWIEKNGLLPGFFSSVLCEYFEKKYNQNAN